MSKMYLMLMFAGMILLALAGFANAWAPIPNYQYGINITNVTWQYSITSAGKVVNIPAAWLLVRLYNITNTNPYDIVVLGYAQNKQYIGKIPGFITTENGTAITLVLNSTAGNGTSAAPWYTATIWYNPQTPDNPLNASTPGAIQQCGDAAAGILASCGYSYGNISFVPPVGIILRSLYSDGQTAQARFINLTLGITPRNSNSPNAYISTLMNVSAIVIVANRSINSTQFSLTFNPDGSHTLKLNNSNSNYKLSTLGGVFKKPYVTGISEYSNTANELYNGIYPFDGTGSEFMLSVLNYNAFAGGNTIGNKAAIYNSTNTIGRYQNLYAAGGAGYINLSVNNIVGNAVIFTLLPAFTLNYTTSNAFFNPYAANSLNFDCMNTVLGIQQACSFNYQTLIRGINWTYNYTTYALPAPYNGIPWTVNIRAGYMILKLPPAPFFGSTCNRIYLALNSSDNYDTIPFFIQNFTNGCTLIVRNTSVNGYHDFDQFRVYSAINPVPFASNIVVYNQWKLGSGSSFTVPAANAPFVITLSSTLNPSSQIYTLDPSRECKFSINNNGIYNLTFVNSGYYCALGSAPSGTIGDFNGLKPTQFLFTPTITTDNWPFPYNSINGDLFDFIAPNLLGQYQSAYLHASIDNAWTLSNTITTLNSGLYEAGAPVNMTFNMVAQTALVIKPYTTNYIISITCAMQNTYILYNSTLGWICSLNNSASGGIPNISPQPPHLSGNESGINYSNQHKDILNISVGSLAMITLAPGVQFSAVLMLVFGIIAILIGVSMFGLHIAGHYPFVVMLVGLWLMSIWVFPIAYVAAIASIMFAIAEFTIHRQKQREGGHGGNSPPPKPYHFESGIAYRNTNGDN